MKLFILCLLLTVFHASGSIYSQHTSFNLNYENITVSEALTVLESNSKYKFLYRSDMIDLDRKVNLLGADKRVDEVLSMIFPEGNASFRFFEDNLVAITTELYVEQQQNIVTGRVTEGATGESLTGVSVTIPGTTIGTLTDIDGNYSLTIPPDASRISFSFVGMLTQLVVIGDQRVINVTMEQDAIGLEEVLVVGYGTQVRADLTGAVSSISSDEIANRLHLSNTALAMQGLSPGLIIQNFGGEPGRENLRVRIRGIGTLNNANPLILVDGIEQSLSTVEPADIETFTILKDAASAAIYGSRAANGVILITTKRGAQRGTSVSYSVNVGFQNPSMFPEATDTESWMRLENEAHMNAGSTPLYSEEYIQNVKNGTNPLDYPWSVWEDEIFVRNALQQRHSLSLSSGGEFGRIYSSLNYTDQAGIIQNFNNQRISLRVNSDLYASERLTFNFDLTYRNRDVAGPGFGQQPILNAVLHGGRNIVAKYPDGTYGNLGPWHARVMSENGERTQIANDIISTAGFNYQIIPTLVIQGDVTLKSISENESTFMNTLSGVRHYVTGRPVVVHNKFLRNSMREEQINTREWSQRAYLNYNESIGRHTFQAVIGYEGIYNNFKNIVAFRDNYFSNDLRDISAGSLANQSTGGSRSEWRLRSFFNRVNYAFDNRYLLQVNMRYDGSSRFGEGNRWGFFPSFSAGWRISQEDFMINSEFINNLKLRASWGQLGNQEIGLYRFMNTYNLAQGYQFNNSLVSGSAVTLAGNQAITWETTTMTNIGLDLGFLNNRIDLTAEYFWNLTEDILISLPIPPSIGVGAPTQNAAAVSNVGYEISLNYRSPSRTDGGFQYSVGVNFSDVINKIEDLKGTGPYFPDKFSIWQEGYSMNSLRGLSSPGIYLTQEDLDNYPVTINPVTTFGDLIYEDLNKDGVISNALYPDGDQIIMGNEDPRYEFGITASATYRSFDFSFFLQGVLQQQHSLDGSLMEGSNWQNFITKTYARETWHPERNPNGTWPKTQAGDSWNLHESTFWLQDTKYMRLKNFQIGYTIRPQAMVSSMRIYLSGENLLTWTGTELFDPESPRGRNQFFPHTKILSAGAQVTF